MMRKLMTRLDALGLLAFVSFVVLMAVHAPETVVAQGTPIRTVNCVVTVSTATTLTAVGGDCAAPGAGKALYITGVSFGSSAASSTAADSFPTLKSGTGGSCGVATAVVWSAMSAANTTVVESLTRPMPIAANSELCWIHSVAGSKVVRITGFIAAV